MSVRTFRYSLPNVPEWCEGWAIIFLDSTGCFSALSDYGNYAYRWPDHGWGDFDFRKFFIERGDDYLLGKIAPNDVYDEDETLRAIKKTILSERRHAIALADAAWTRERARQEWDLLDRYGWLDSEEAFQEWTRETSLDDPWMYQERKTHPRSVAFTKKVMPRLRAIIRDELLREGVHGIRESRP